MGRVKYIHEEFNHNLESPNQIVPLIMSLLQPKSVIDLGCGTGTFLKAFKTFGIKEILGVEGSWVNKELLFKNIACDEYLEADLEQPFNLGRKFDLVLCLEVAEHLNPNAADILVENLVSLGDVILFSAAIPYQGGQNHINEQWPQYWQEKFSSFNYDFYDNLRNCLWENNKVFWWYKQNSFLVIKRSSLLAEKWKRTSKILNYVNPELFLKKSEKLESIISGNETFEFYLKLFFRKIKNSVNFKRRV